MSGWSGPILTDSGGFQAYSLIRENDAYGSLSDAGLTFRPEGSKRKVHLTAEKCVQLQLRFGSDIVMCLDDCTHSDDTFERQQLSVRRTIAWARRCKREMIRLCEERSLEADQRPLLFAVIQGGSSQHLRRECAEELIEIGFDGFGFGGWPLDARGHLVEDSLAYTRELVPKEFPLHALGVGHPANIAVCVRLGYDLFDSALPTRDARQGRLYVWPAAPRAGDAPHGVAAQVSYMYVGDEKHVKSSDPVSNDCDCSTCATYSRGYLHHLYKLKDGLYARLATIHNLRFVVRLTMLCGEAAA
jgi:queuine tRNA-ribosyltransferase